MADPVPETATGPFAGVSNFLSFWEANDSTLIFILIVLAVSIFATQRLGPVLKKTLLRLNVPPRWASEAVLLFYFVAAYFMMAMVLINLGVDRWVVRGLGLGLVLASIVISLLIRPYLPKLPFVAGNLIRTGELLGKVEHISLVSTRLRTFDGLMVTVPNAKILNDYVINYHTTPNRRVKIDLDIKQGQDVLAAKRIIEKMLISDPRVLPTPRPTVSVLGAGEGRVRLGGRGWVKNPKAWVTRCDVLEKTMFAFEHAGIDLAIPKQQMQMLAPASTDDQAEQMMASEP